MSADNFFAVRQDPADGSWVLSMGFESDDTPPCKLPVRKDDPRFSSQDAATLAGLRAYSEYGVSTEPWCVHLPDHLPGCPYRYGR